MNNNQIDNTDYYRLPCGKYLEDFIWKERLGFAIGSALKYIWRAGKKDGELAGKDVAKCQHYVKFVAEKTNVDYEYEMKVLAELCCKAADWNGSDDSEK